MKSRIAFGVALVSLLAAVGAYGAGAFDRHSVNTVKIGAGAPAAAANVKTIEFDHGWTSTNRTISINTAGEISVSPLATVGPVYASTTAGKLASEVNLDVVRGGTGLGTLTQNGVVYGNGTSDVGITAAGTNNTVLHGNTSAAPTYSAIVSGDITDGTILNVDVNSSAAIDGSKISPVFVGASSITGNADVTQLNIKGHTTQTDITSPVLLLQLAGNDVSFNLQRSAGTYASPTVVASGNSLGVMNWMGYDGNSFEQAAQIRVSVGATPGDGDMPGQLEFYTTPDGSATPSQRMIIDQAGRAGIGAAAVSGIELNVGGNIQTTGYVTGTTSLVVYGDNSASRGLEINTAGDVGIGAAPNTGAARGESLLVTGDTMAITMSNSETTGNTHDGALSVTHFTTASAPLGVIYGASTTSTGVVTIGGGYSENNAATKVAIYGASGNTTATGTELAEFGLTSARIYAANGNSAGVHIVKDGSNIGNSNFIDFSYSGTSAANGTVWGGIRRNAGNTAFEFYESSDVRLKRNVEPITDGLQKIAGLNPVTFEWKDDSGGGRGFIAQEVQKVIPEMVGKNRYNDGQEYLDIGYSELYPLLVSAIKELKARNERLEKRLDCLENSACTDR